MKHAEQETLHAKDTPSRDVMKPTQSNTSVRQKRHAPFLFRVWAFFWNALHRKRVPELRQQSQVECGLACLAMILSYYGRKTSISELRTRYKVSRDGLSALGIVRAARDFGMRVRAISLQQNDFRFVKLPAIVHWEFNHFLVVERWSRKWVKVVDPARGRLRLTYDEFDAGFTGVVITLEPGDAFDRHAVPSPRSFRSYVLQSIRQAPATILQILGASLLLELFGLILPLVTKVVIDQIVPFRMSNVMAVLGMGILVLFLAQTIATLLRGWLVVYLQARIDMHMMLGFVEHLLRLPYSFFQQRSAGDLLTRMASNAMLRDILGNQLIATLLDSSLVIFYLIILLWLSLPFGLVTLGIGVLQVLLLLGSSRSISNLAGRELAAQGKAQGYLAEVLEGIATLKGSGAEQRAFERWSNLFFDQLNISMRYSYFSSTMSMIMTALGTLAPLALLWVGAIQVLDGSITLGTMVALTALAGTFLTPLSSVVTSGQRFQLIGAHLDRIADVTEAEPEQKEQEVQQPPQLTGNIRLEHVSFSYAADVPEVLHGIDLAVEAGQKVAIVGPSGSGKSTLGKLLLGLYVPTKGTILYDGIPLQQLNYREVRRQFGVVLQEFALFSGSVLSNIALNNPTIDKEQVVEAAEIAAIHEDIMDMPMGYETLVAEGGSALSGGQRQRLAIARAIAHKPSILLLDEATSHLDVATEQRVAERLQSLACTQIIIAHRLSTIRNADVILVMNRGNIVERGSHEELLQRNGYYARLMHQQLERGIVTPDKAKAEVNEASIMEEPTIPRMKALRTQIPHKVTLEPSSPASTSKELSPQFAQTSSSNGHLVLPPEKDSSEEETQAHPPSHVPPTALAPSSVIPVSSTATVSGLGKRDTLVMGLMVLLLTCVLSAALLLVLIHTESKPTIQMTSPLSTPTVVASATPTPDASMYPSFATSYAGTVADLKTSKHTPLLLTNIQQSQGNILGSFKGLGLVGPFKGKITPSGQVQFTVTIFGGKETLMFEGNIKVGGDMAGSFTVLNPHGQSTGETGLWNVAAGS